MKKMMKGRLVCVALIAAALVVTCLIGIGKWTADAAYNGEMASSDPENILSKIPAYTHTGTHFNMRTQSTDNAMNDNGIFISSNLSSLLNMLCFIVVICISYKPSFRSFLYSSYW